MADLVTFQWVRRKAGYKIWRTDSRLSSYERRKMREHARDLARIHGGDVDEYLEQMREESRLSHIHIESNEGELEIIYPLEDKLIFKEFAECTTELEILEFANRYGLLRAREHKLESARESLSEWTKAISIVRDWDNAWKKFKDNKDVSQFLASIRGGRFGETCSLEAGLQFSKATDRPLMYLRPDSLLSAIQFQHLQAISTDSDLRQCEVCRAWFSYGSGTGKRKTRVYCSDRCRQIAFKKRRAANDAN